MTTFGTLLLVNRDGSCGSSVCIRKTMVFGSSYPAHIRIRSKYITEEHARLEVDENGKCFLVPLADKHEPKINRRKLKSRAMLSHNDRISLGGRVFIFESCPDSETKKVECNKYDFAQQGRISLLKKNGASATTVRIHREVTIGSEFPSNFRIKSKHLSKQHLKITLDQSQFILTHMAKENAPLINEVPFQSPAVLEDGDRISIKGFKFLFTCCSETIAEEQSEKMVLQDCSNNLHIDNDRNSGEMVVEIADDCSDSSSLTSNSSCSTRRNERIRKRDNLTSPVACKLTNENCRKSDVAGDKEFNMPSKNSIDAMKLDTNSLQPNGRPSLETMAVQWEFMRDQFLGSSDEALRWMMLSKKGGMEAYKHANKMVVMAEEQYYKSLYEIDMLSSKKKLVDQLMCMINKLVNNKSASADENLKKLNDVYTNVLKGICSKHLSNEVEKIINSGNIVNPDSVVVACRNELKILSERMQSSSVASEESLAEIEKWRDREQNTNAYIEVKQSEEREWMEKEADRNAKALAEMRKIIPANISKLSLIELNSAVECNGGYYGRRLSTEIKRNKLLHLVVMHPDDIAKLNFLAGDFKQYFMDLNLDVTEMRAIRMCLPDSFELDKDGKKAAWRETFVTKLKQMVLRESGELTKGGWDPDLGKRVMVRMPPLSPGEARRSVYYYETRSQLQHQLERLEKLEASLLSKRESLATAEKKHLELKKEFDVTLSECRHPGLQQRYGAEILAQAKSNAKEELLESDSKCKNLRSDISRVESSITSFSWTKQDMLRHIALHEQLVPNWSSADGDILISGVFDSNPVIERLPKATATFASASQEANGRKAELEVIKASRKSTVVQPPSSHTRPPPMVTMSCADGIKKQQMESKLNKIFSKKSLDGTTMESRMSPVKSIKSRHLQKLVNKEEDGKTSCSARLLSQPKPQLSFLDQLKTLKKKSP